MKDAEVYSGEGNYLPWENEKYKVRILKTFSKETRQKGPAFIAEFEVLDSTTDEVEVGEKRTWFQGLTNKDIAFPAIKEFLLGVMRVDMNDREQLAEFDAASPEMMEEFGSEEWETKSEEDHPLYGTTVKIETIKKTTQEDKPFTKHKWIAWKATEEELGELLSKRKSF